MTWAIFDFRIDRNWKFEISHLNLWVLVIPSTIVSHAKSSPLPFLFVPEDETSDDVSLELPPASVESSEADQKIINHLKNNLSSYTINSFIK